jgi:hypothetical protein
VAEKKLPVFKEVDLGVASQLELQTAVRAWKEANDKLATAKADEMDARLAIVNKWFPNFVEGTNTGQLREENIKCTMPMNRTVNQDLYAEAWEWATKEETVPRIRLRELLKMVFKPVYELRIGVWKDLSDAERKKLADIVTEKPGTPAIKVEARSK